MWVCYLNKIKLIGLEEQEVDSMLKAFIKHVLSRERKANHMYNI